MTAKSKYSNTRSQLSLKISNRKLSNKQQEQIRTSVKKSCFYIKSQAILCNAQSSAFVSYELITSNKQISDSDEYLDFTLEPNNERKL